MTTGRKISLFTFILLPVLVLAIFSFLQTKERLVNNVYQERRTLAAVSAAMLSEKLNRLSELGLSLASWPVFNEHFADGKWEHAIELMEKVPLDFRYINRVFIADDKGNPIAGTSDAEIKNDTTQTKAKWLAGVSKKWQPYLSEVYTYPVSPNLIMCAFAVPIKAVDGKVKAILVLEVNVDKLLEWSSGIPVGESGYIYIIDQKGHIAINPDYKQKDSIVDYSSVPAVQKALSGQKNVEILYNPIEKEQRLNAYEKVPNYDWAVVVQQNADDALAINKSLWPVLFFFTLVILLAVVFAWYIIRGIIRQTQTEKELSRYIDIVEHTHVVIRNMDNKIIFWNKGMEELYGWKKHEAIGKITHQLFSAQFPKPLTEITAFLLKNNYWQGELKHTRKDGTVIHVSSHWQLHRDANGKPEAIIETNNDITKFKDAQEKLRRSEESIHLLIDNVKDYAIFMLDKKGRIASWNSGAAHIKGYTEAEAIGKSIDIFYTTTDLEKNQPALNLQQAEKFDHYETEGWRVRKDGSLFYANVVFTALRDPSGQVYGYSKISRDITEKKKAQEQLEFLSRQINQSNDAIYTLGTNFKITSWNLGAQKVYGFTEAEALGRDSNELLSTVISKQDINDALKEIHEQNYWTGELKRKRKDGTDIFVRSSSTSVKDQDDNITGYVSVSFDISEQKKLQEQVTHLASIVEQSSEAILSRDASHCIISWNKGAEKLFGYSKEEAIGKTVAELGFIKITPRVTQELENDLQQKGSWETEKVHYHKDGSFFFGAVTANMVKNELDQSSSVVFIIKDISLRKKLEDQLKQSNEELEEKVKLRTAEILSSEKRFRTLIENSTDVITMMDKSFNLIYRSPAAERITGWSNEDMINVDATRNIHPDDVEEVKAIVGEVMANPGRQYHTLFRNLHKKGHYIWMEGVLINWLYDTNVNAIVFNYRDVTAQKEAQEKLVQSERRYRSTLDNMIEGIQIIGFDWKYIYVNDAVIKQAKYTKEQFIGHTVMELFPGIENAPIFANCIRCMQERIPIQCESEMIFPDKTVEWFEQSFQPVPEGIFILSVNITERKKAEEKLNEQRAQLQTLSDNLPGVMIYQIAGDTQQNKKFTYVGNSVTQLTGKTPEEVMNDPSLLYSRILEEDIPLMLTAEKKALETMTIFNVEVRFRSIADGIRWLNIISTPRKLNTGKIVWDGFHVDITERKNAAEAIKKSEEHYRLLVEQAVDGIFLSDSDGKYIDVNSAGCKMLGYRHDEMITKTIKDVIIPEEVARIPREITRFENGNIAVSEWHFLRKNGTVFIGEIIGRMLPNGRLQAILRDITERKESELRIKKLNEELEDRVALRTAELKKSNEEMEAFTYSVSHDLRAPLRGILGFTSILEEDYGARLDIEARRITSVIKNNTIRMGNLIDDLLAFSRIGRQQLEKSLINTNEMLQQIITTVEFNKIAANAEWIIPSLPNAYADINSIRQVWINLISNAIKYSSEQPKQRIEIGASTTKEATIFFVKDNGVGFNKKYSDKLFKVFQRLHDANEFEGTGVGLAIVEKIISKHGGKAWAESEIGHGATFYFSLPNETTSESNNLNQ